MERDDRPPVATFFCDGRLTAGSTVALDEDAAHHARVKRLAAGDPVRLTNGMGSVARASIVAIGKRDLELLVGEVTLVPRPPGIHLRVPVGDRDRMLVLAEKATELGVASWQAVRFRRSMSVSPRGEGTAFAEKTRARMIAALEQSSGAWLPDLLPDVGPAAIAAPPGVTRILLDAGGQPLLRLCGAGEGVVLFGPEGGLETDEREALEAFGWRVASLAATTLRFETAGIAAVAVVRAAQMLERSTDGEG